MKKIIFTTDFLFHSPKNVSTNHEWFLRILEPVIASAVDAPIKFFSENFGDNSNSKFSREYFFSMNGIDIKKYPYEDYIPFEYDNLNNESLNYLKTFFDKGDIYIGIELGEIFRKVLDSFGVKYINFWFHPFKLFDDIVFLVGTNSQEIYNKIYKYKIPESSFRAAGLYWKTKINRQFGKTIDNKIPENSLLFVGQSLKDSSVKCKHKYLTILDYKDKIDKLSNSYEKIIYSPHPSYQKNTDIEAYLRNNDKIEVTTIPTYYLLTSKNIRKVVSLSSSVLFEAQYFNKEIEYLYKPQFDIDEKFKLDGRSFVSVQNWYFKSQFWSDILADEFPVKKEGGDFDYYIGKNKLRNILNNWHGFKVLDPDKILENKFLEQKKKIDDLLKNLTLQEHRRYPITENLITRGFEIYFSSPESEIYLDKKGFWDREVWGQWTKDDQASISFRNEAQSPYLVELFFHGFTVKHHSINVDVWKNSQLIRKIELKDKHEVIIQFLVSPLEKDVKISFDIKNSISPAEINGSGDNRRLGIGISKIRFKSKKEWGMGKISNIIRNKNIFKNKETVISCTESKNIGKRQWQGDSYSTPGISAELRKGINSIGFFKENIGFSHHVRYFTRSLLRTKIPFSCKHFEFKKGDHINFEFNDYISDQLPFNVNVFSFSAPYCIEYQKKFPRDFYGRYNIGYGAWEYDKYPLNWLHQCDFLDEIWAISDFNQQVFSRYFSIPVVKIPLPVDFDVNSVSLFTRKYFNLPENKFLFLFSYDSGSDLSGRKNPIAVIKAFEKAFPANKKEAALVIKIAGRGSADDLNATKQIKQLTDLYRNRDDIIFIDKILSDREMKGLIHCIDVYVSLHRCEGFGLGMAEAMKLGKPVIATNYSGNLEFMKYNNSCLVDYTLVPAHGFEDLISGHHWAEPNIEHAAYFMKKLFNDKNYYSKISIAASSYLDENFSFVAISNKIKFRLKILGLL